MEDLAALWTVTFVLIIVYVCEGERVHIYTDVKCHFCTYVLNRN